MGETGIPTGLRVPDGFVCWTCREPSDIQHGPGVRLDARMASGRECIRCGDRMPHLARVRLLPDGASLVRSPSSHRPRETPIKVERETDVVVDDHALLYLNIGTDLELGIEMTPAGRVKVWVHLDQDAWGPIANWEFDPSEGGSDA